MANFTKKAIKETFISLLKEKPFNQITVKDIVDECGVNRNTFYYHYEDINDLLENVITEETDVLIKNYPTIDSLDMAVEVAIKYVLENKKIILNIYNYLDKNIYERFIMETCEYTVRTLINSVTKNMSISDKDKNFLISFIKCQFFGFCIDWLSRNLDEEYIKEYVTYTKITKEILIEFINKHSN